MKYQILFITITALFVSCSNDKKTTEITKQVSPLKSDILLESNSYLSLNSGKNKEYKTLFISGKNLLKGTATYKVTNEKGEELNCETFPAAKLIQEEYKTANSTLKAQHLREVVEGFFMEEDNPKFHNL
ncbi:hypothetical protein [uncultured Maribacter sp.]|uniref:hypothetical protein n=1 Tax=uncultured Maribacter sp. TaxID=431308 RepID=UPI002611D892|nr:hypothetical protein [uncultured Maribacter sp.]